MFELDSSRPDHLPTANRQLTSPATSGRRQASSWPSQHLLELTDANFACQVLEADLPVVVDFWAESCVPCRVQEPTIDRLASELQGRARVGRVDVDVNPVTIQTFAVKGVPHLMVVRAREVVLELIGDHSYEQLHGYLRSVGLF